MDTRKYRLQLPSLKKLRIVTLLFLLIFDLSCDALSNQQSTNSLQPAEFTMVNSAVANMQPANIVNSKPINKTAVSSYQNEQPKSLPKLPIPIITMKEAQTAGDKNRSALVLPVPIILVKIPPLEGHINNNQSTQNTNTDINNLQLPLPTTFINTTTQTDNSSPIFVETNEPPPGFEALANSQHRTIIDVYYGNNYVDAIPGSYGVSTLRFSNAKSIVDKLPGIIHKEEVTQALSGLLAAHSNLLCKDPNNRTNCGLLLPKVAGVIFDPNTFRADIFINQKYMTAAPEAGKLLPASSGGLSYANQVLGSIAGQLNNNNDLGDNNQTYNFRNIGILAYQQSRFNSEISVANNGLNQSPNAQIEQANLEWNKSQYLFETGLLNTPGGLFITSQNVLGAYAGTSLDTVQDLNETLGIPLQIFLPLPSQVNVYQNGRLIYSRFYDMGNHTIDTSTFPQGSYDITLVIRNSAGTSEETRFFSKITQIPPLQFPQYYAALGMLESYANPYSTLPQFTNIPIFQAGINKRIGPRWGVNSNLLASNKVSYLESGVFFLHHYFTLEPKILVSTDGDFGVGASTNWRLGKLNGVVSAQNIWAHNSNNNLMNLSSPYIGPTYNTFDIITQNTTQFGAGLSYPWRKALISFNANYNKTLDSPASYAYGPTVRINLSNRYRTTSYFTLSATRSTDQDVVLATFNVNFNSPTWTLAGNTGYNAVSADSSSNNNNNGYLVNGTAIWKQLDAAQEGLQLGVSAGVQANEYNAGSSFDYLGNQGHYMGNINYTKATDSQAATFYSLNNDTRFVVANKSMSIGGSKQGNSGVLIYIKSPHSGDEFEVKANNAVVKIIKTNDATPVFLTPFRTYKISINSISPTSYSYDEKTKTVTLYPGNFIKLKWIAANKLILFGRILNSQHQPIANALVEGGLEFNATDMDGYLQIEVIGGTHELTVTDENDNICKIIIPQTKANEGYINLGNLICSPIGKIKQTAKTANT